MCMYVPVPARSWHERITPTAPHTKPGEEADGKFFGNFPYPYMNGLLHLGHAFSLSKVRGMRGPVRC